MVTLNGKTITIAAVAVLLVAGIGIFLVDGSEDDGRTRITVGGSTTIQPIMAELADGYYKTHGDVEITVLGGGSGVGASNTANGTFDIGMCSRNLKQSEVDLGLREVRIGYDGVAVIANVEGVGDLTMEQLAGIFSGEIGNWKDVGGPDRRIAVVIRDDASGTRECFDKAMAGAVDGWEVKEGVPEQSSTNGVVSQVSSTPGAIGYISIGAVDGLPQGTCVLTVDGVTASDETVSDGGYPLQRDLVLCTDGEATGEVAAFIDWILGPEGQAIVGEEFVTLN